MAEKNLDAIISRLEDTNSEARSRSAAAIHLRENVESWCQGAFYPTFLAKFVPTALKVLDGAPSFLSSTPEQVLRNSLLETFHRLPVQPPEAIEPHLVSIVDKLRELVKVENEDNAIVCIKVVMDLQRHHVAALKDRVQPFLELIKEIFGNTERIARENFSVQPPQGQLNPSAAVSHSQSPRPGSPAVPAPDAGAAENRPLLKATQSFKVVAETPIAVVSIFQQYRDVPQTWTRQFVPLMKTVLYSQAPAQENAHAEAKAQHTFHFGVAKGIKNRAAFGDLVTAQVKMMSFVAFILRVFGQSLQDFLPKLPEIVVRLLRDCPREKCQVRKELIVAIRHIINFNFRKVFLPVIDDLLDERTLLGDGLTVHDALRPLSYSTLADLIHHVRDSLSMDQIRTTVKVYRQNMLGHVAGTSFQTMSAKLLLNMAECIAKLEDKKEARYFLMTILEATGDKCAAMNRQYHNAVKISSQHDYQNSEVSSADFMASKDHAPAWDDVDIFSTQTIKTNNLRDRAADPVTDNKFLFKNLVNGLKGVFYQLRVCNPPNMIDPANEPVNWNEIACGFSAEEVQVLIKLFHEGTKMFQYYQSEKPASESNMSPAEILGSHHPVCGKDEKDLLDSFATVFHHVDPATFHEIFHSEIPHIYEMMFEHPALLQIPQFLLASEATSPHFAGMLLQFLMSKIEDVGSSDINKATILLRLFKLSFMAVTLFSAQNEAVLLPHVNKLVTSSIRLSTTAEAPLQYFYLLRSLFRSIGGGRFEHLYHEILPLLEMLLEVLNDLISAARSTAEQDLYVELSLTVPARLSNLLPHLSYLMKPLVLALRAGSELVSQGLRTLELCVDNLTADYLDPIMAPVIDDLMTALWDHLKPSPYNHFHAHTTMRILGKLGGRNRKFLEGPPSLRYKFFAESGSTVDLQLIGASSESRFPVELGIDVAVSKLREAAPKPTEVQAIQTLKHLKQQAFQFVVTQIKLLLGPDDLHPDFLRLVRLHANKVAESNLENVSTRHFSNSREQNIAKKDESQETLKKLLKTCIYTTSSPDLSTAAHAFLSNIYKHFAILEIGQALIDLKAESARNIFQVDISEGPVEIDHRVLVMAIVESLSSEEVAARETAQNAIVALHDAASVLFGSKAPVMKLPMFTQLLNTSCHSCYKPEWFSKAGGALGINTMATKLGLDGVWFVEKQLDICRALMYAAKDLPEDLPQSTRVQALDTLKIILRKCNSDITVDEAVKPGSKIHSLCSFLVPELAHSCRHVRQVAQSGLSILADICGAQPYQLVAPVKQRLFYVFTKPVRALPISIQIGYIDAVTYLMQLKHGILEPSEEINRFLRETTTISDSDLESVSSRPLDQRHLENMTKLKVSCLRLLQSSLNYPEANQSPTGKSQPRMISIFFKALYSRHSEIHQAAHDALKEIYDRDPKVPKDVLTNGLRPILVSLQDPSKLKLDNLQCLSRLLQILKNYFKVEIGGRLLDNSPAIANDDVLEKASFKLIWQHESIQLVTALIDIFHRLPVPGSHIFMDRLIDKVLVLEQRLRRTQFSPFREPLIKYLNRFPVMALERLGASLRTNRSKACFFAQILANEVSQPLREAIVQNSATLTECFPTDAPESEQILSTTNVIHLTDTLCAYPEVGKTLLNNTTFRGVLIERGKMLWSLLQKNEVDASIRLATEQMCERLMSIIVFYLSHNVQDMDCVFDTIEAVTSQTLKDSARLQRFFYDHIISPGDVSRWRQVIERSIDVFVSQEHSESMKAYVLRNLVSPILAQDIMKNWDMLSVPGKGTQLVDRSFVDMFTNRIWSPEASMSFSDEKAPVNIDHSRIELLQVTALLLKYYNNIVKEVRKYVIRFSWQYIKLEDTINKYAAYVVVSYFIAIFDTPAKIAFQVYPPLLIGHTNDARSLVAQALEILAPVIPKSMSDHPDFNAPCWIVTARKCLADDPSNVQQMTSVFQFVARHSSLFYESAEVFAQIIIPNLHKVANLPAQSIEVKKLAVSLFNLIWSWEKQYVSEKSSTPGTPSGKHSPKKRKADGTEAEPHNQPKSFITSSGLRISFLKYLVHFLAASPDRFHLASPKGRNMAHANTAYASQAANLCRQALEIFSNLLSPTYWDDLDVDAMFPKITEAVLLTDPKQDDKTENSVTRIVNTLQMLDAMLRAKDEKWVCARIPQLQKLLEKPIRNTHPDVQDCLFAKLDQHDEGGDQPQQQSFICRILATIPNEANDDDAASETEAPTSDFVTFLSTVATETLSTNNIIPGVNVLTAFAESRPREIDQHLPQIMKHLNTFVKDHISESVAETNRVASAQQNSRPSETSHHFDQYSLHSSDRLFLKMIRLAADRVAQLGDQRRPFLTMLNSIIERSLKIPLVSSVVDIVSGWVFDSNSAFPTLKEKNSLVLKMQAFERKPDQTLFDKFLDIIIRVYEDPKITRSELAVRLEQAFLIGTRAPNIEMRSRFMNLFDRHLSRTASKRALYLLQTQDWLPLADSFWLSQVIQLLFGSVEMDGSIGLSSGSFTVPAPSNLFVNAVNDLRKEEIIVDDACEEFISTYKSFSNQLKDVRASELLSPLSALQYAESSLAKDVWAFLLPVFWSTLNKEERGDLQHGLISLMVREFHIRQVDKRPNCIQALLGGVVRAENPRMNFPHNLIKFLARTYDAWYVATCFMEQTANEPVVNSAVVRESNLDALAEVYAQLLEEDLFYGLWRRRSQFLTSNTALSYEQIGNWERAQRFYEAATFKARTGEVPFSQSEYMLWEDHWVLCAERLQQWDILSDFAKVDSLNDLYLEAVWRQFDKWQNPEQLKGFDGVVKSISDAPTPRRMFFQCFTALIKTHQNMEQQSTFHRVCDEAIQLSIRKWHQLPNRITNAHIPILQNFQQLVELHDASVICTSLSATNSGNMEAKAPELKLLLGTWRDRLPNFWDGIDAWQDLVTWRRHIFQMVNEKYLNLMPQQQNTSASGNSFAYRGFHETAWTINKFAHVLRKHDLPEVCMQQLSTIYTLPNIEIQEAFLKLREQAKCQYQTNKDLQAGLDVINNTNLNYFGQQQKAEFYTLKGMFLEKQNQLEQANEAFGSALFYDLKLPKAWAEWARYNEQIFKETNDISKAQAALSCYLEAAGTYKSSKSRKAIGRILWLLSLDDPEGHMSSTFEEYKGDTPIWYWITFIPQLLYGVSRGEAKIARSILVKLAKTYPQALYYPLRTSREDYQAIRKQQEARMRNSKSTENAQAVEQSSPESRPRTSESRGEAGSRPGTATSEGGGGQGNQNARSEPNGAQDQPESNQQSQDPNSQQQGPSQPAEQAPAKPLEPWDHLDEIYSVLKTAFPLLSLSMEAMVEQIARYFKSTPDEEAYRLINMLLNDALGYVSHSPARYSKGTKLPPSTEAHITRFAGSLLPAHIQKVFEADFLKEKPDIIEYIRKVRRWRDRFEEKLDRSPRHTSLEVIGHYLSEFKFNKFDDVEIPGQYLVHKDKNHDFIRIERFLPDVELTRNVGICPKRLKIRGHDGSVHSFQIQHPSNRNARREERMVQMFRFFNDVLSKRKESRRRKIQFTLAVMVPLAPSIRMVQDDPSYISLSGIYDDYCRRKPMLRDEPILFTVSKLRELQPRTTEQAAQIKLQIFEAISSRYVPKTIVHDFFRATYDSFADFWLFRRQTSYQLAALSFMTYVMSMRDRFPSKMNFSRSSGAVWGSELVPGMAPQKPIFQNSENVQIRFTPNLQTLLGPIAIEGIYTASMHVIAKSLADPFSSSTGSSQGPNSGTDATADGQNNNATTNGAVNGEANEENRDSAGNAAPPQRLAPDSKLESLLSVFIRDEVLYWFTSNKRPTPSPSELREHVQKNGEQVVKRAIALAKEPDGGLPANQSVIDVVNKSGDPTKLATMDLMWMAYL